MAFTWFSFALIALFATVASFEVFRAIQRGYIKTFISLGTVIVSVLLSALATPTLSRFVCELFFYPISRSSAYRSAFGDSVAMNELVQSCVGMILGSVVFVLIFVIFRAILSGVIKILNKKLLKPRPNDPEYKHETKSWFDRNSKSVGIFTGIITAFVVTLVISSPLVGTVKLAGRGILLAERSNSAVWSAVGVDQTLIDDAKKYDDDIAVNLLYSFGGEAIYHMSAATIYDGETMYLLAELDLVEEALDDFLTVVPVIKDEASPEEKHIEALDDLCDFVDKSTFCKPVLAEFLPGLTGAWSRGNLYFKMPKPEVSPFIEPAFDELLKVCKDAEPPFAKEHTKTLLRCYSLILESGMTELDYDADPKDVMDLIETSAILDKLYAELDRGMYMSDVKEKAETAALYSYAKALDGDEYGQEEYDTLLLNLSDAYNLVLNKGYKTREDKVDVLAAYTERYMNSYGLEMPDSISAATAEVMITEFSSVGEITPEDLEKFFEQYK